MTSTTTASPAGAGLPPALAAIPPERVSEVDVRDDLRRGEEPFGRIMAARRALAPGSALVVRAIFEPVPLYAVMGAQGLSHHTEKLADDDWKVWFFAADGAGASASPSPSPAAVPSSADGGDSGGAEEGVVVLDVRGLEPPEPMMRTLEALERLGPGETLVQVNERVPQFLLPEVERRGFSYRIHEQDDGPVRVFFQRVQESPTG